MTIGIIWCSKGRLWLDPLGHYLYMTIGIIWSLAAKGRLILKKYLYLGKKKKKKSEPLGPSVRPPPLIEPPVHQKVPFFAPFPSLLIYLIYFGNLKI